MCVVAMREDTLGSCLAEDDVGPLTLGDGEGLCKDLAGDVGSFCVVACWKMSASCLSAASWSLSMVAKGAASAGFSKA
jgi:hypothetical protein